MDFIKNRGSDKCIFSPQAFMTDSSCESDGDSNDECEQ